MSIQLNGTFSLVDNLPETRIKWASPSVVARRLGISRQTLVRLFDRSILPEHLGSKEDSGSYGRWKIRCDAGAIGTLKLHILNWTAWHRKPTASRSYDRRDEIARNVSTDVIENELELSHTATDHKKMVKDLEAYLEKFEQQAKFIENCHSSEHLARFRAYLAWEQLKRIWEGFNNPKTGEVTNSETLHGDYMGIKYPTVKDLARKLEISVASLYRRPFRDFVMALKLGQRSPSVPDDSSSDPNAHVSSLEADRDWRLQRTASGLEQQGLVFLESDKRTHQDRLVVRNKRKRLLKELTNQRRLRWKQERNWWLLESYNPGLTNLKSKIFQLKDLYHEKKLVALWSKRKKSEWKLLGYKDSAMFTSRLGYIMKVGNQYEWERNLEQGAKCWRGRSPKLEAAQAKLVASMPAKVKELSKAGIDGS